MDVGPLDRLQPDAAHRHQAHAGTRTRPVALVGLTRSQPNTRASKDIARGLPQTGQRHGEPSGGMTQVLRVWQATRYRRIPAEPERTINDRWSECRQRRPASVYVEVVLMEQLSWDVVFSYMIRFNKCFA